MRFELEEAAEVFRDMLTPWLAESPASAAQSVSTFRIQASLLLQLNRDDF
jgi:hypothetical protein